MGLGDSLQQDWHIANIVGEVYEVDEPRLARLDILEQHPKLYERCEIQVEMIDGEGKGTVISAMAYILVKFHPHLLDLPMVDNYTNNVNGMTYVGPKDRDASAMPAPLWWYEVHTGYIKPDV